MTAYTRTEPHYGYIHATGSLVMVDGVERAPQDVDYITLDGVRMGDNVLALNDIEGWIQRHKDFDPHPDVYRFRFRTERLEGVVEVFWKDVREMY